MSMQSTFIVSIVLSMVVWSFIFYRVCSFSTNLTRTIIGEIFGAFLFIAFITNSPIFVAILILIFFISGIMLI